DGRRSLRGVRMPGDRSFEETPRLIQHALAEQRASDLKHEVVVVTESERQNAVEARDRTRAIAELEQHLAKPRQRVFVLGVEAHGFLKCAARPHILLSREPGVSHAHMQLDGVRVEPQAFSPRRFTAAAAPAGLKADGAPDVALLVGATSCATAGVFTKNALRAAPVVYDADLLAERPGRMRAVAMNARVANACTGAPGLAAARAMAQAAEQAAGLPPRTALVLSTGVIGVPLPLEQVADGLRAAAGRLTPEGGPEAARAIMTTDTRPKHCAVRFETPAGIVTVGGIAKGAGMIHPDMATLLAVLTTDAVGEPAGLQPLLRRVADRSFNAISVDGDTSTNDTVLLLAGGASGEQQDGVVR